MDKYIRLVSRRWPRTAHASEMFCTGPHLHERIHLFQVVDFHEECQGFTVFSSTLVPQGPEGMGGGRVRETHHYVVSGSFSRKCGAGFDARAAGKKAGEASSRNLRDRDLRASLAASARPSVLRSPFTSHSSAFPSVGLPQRAERCLGLPSLGLSLAVPHTCSATFDK